MHGVVEFHYQPTVFCNLEPAVRTKDEGLTPLHFAARYIPIYHVEDMSIQERELLSSSRKAVKYLVEDCKVSVNCKVNMHWGMIATSVL